jgi:tRNA-2-methylthio-N6-dimethylallyladenosine synthase
MENEKSLIKNQLFFIKVYGCQYNEWDGARLNFLLNKFGLIESDEKNADIIILLNCSVRKTAVDRAMSMVKNWQGKKIIVTACVLPDDRQKFINKNVILWDGENFEELVKLLGLNISKSDLANILSGSTTASAYIPIMRGCNNFCSYCAVPYTRGREASRPIEEIICDVEKLITAGRKEIWLLGQNVNSYNHPTTVISSDHREPRDLVTNERFLRPLRGVEMTVGKSDFPILLEMINTISGDFKVYFTSNHPKDMSDDIIEAIAKLPKIAKLIHLPVQSGSNKVLKEMNRPYTIEKYLDVVKRMKSLIPNLELTTDFIVGFPSESEADFQATIDLVNKVNYKQAFVNKYSPRTGTKAFALGDPIPWHEKERRWRVLNEMINKK